MRLRFLFLAVATALIFLPTVASAQFQIEIRPPYQRYDPPPPPPGYYERRRDYYDDRRYDDRRYRERDVYRSRGVFCAREGGFCSFQGPAIVRYGGAGRFTSRRAFNGIPCTNGAFGDPAPGVDKACFID